MRTHVLLNLLNDVRKRYICEACILSRILSLYSNEFHNFNNTSARMLDYIYHIKSSILLK